MEIKNQQELFPQEISNSGSSLENPRISNRITDPDLQNDDIQEENDDIATIIEPVEESEVTQKDYIGILKRVLSFKNRMTEVVTTKSSKSDSGQSGARNYLGRMM